MVTSFRREVGRKWVEEWKFWGFCEEADLEMEEAASL